MRGDRHTLDENASKIEPAKLLAVFVVNKTLQMNNQLDTDPAI